MGRMPVFGVESTVWKAKMGHFADWGGFGTRASLVTAKMSTQEAQSCDKNPGEGPFRGPVGF